MNAAGGPAGAALRSAYDKIAADVATHRPVCTGSGRCCHFGRFDHMLLTTGLEAAYTIANLPEGVGLEDAVLQSASDQGTCPFLIGKTCVAHGVKPGACRVFFCDPSRAVWMQDLGEAHAIRVRDLHRDLDIAYRYAEWGALLEAFIRAGFTRPVSLNEPRRIGLRVLGAGQGGS